jgi:CBS domain-containing protein
VLPLSDTEKLTRAINKHKPLENEMPITIDLRVAECMTRSVVSVNSNADLTKAIGIMDRESLSALPVVDDAGCVCGILSNSDLVRITYDLQCDVCVLPHVSECVRKTLIDSLAEDNEGIKVSSVMTANVETISEMADIAEAATRMIASEIHHLPVVDESKRPIGIIATTDIVRAVANARQASDSGDNVLNLGNGRTTEDKTLETTTIGCQLRTTIPSLKHRRATNGSFESCNRCDQPKNEA